MKESDTFRLDFPTAINTDRAESHQRPSRAKPSGLPIIHGRAAGIDIGSRFHVVAVSPDLCDEPVQTFQAFTSDLVRLADWLISLGIETVAMESTGVYWVAAFEVLESKGLNVILANAREARAVPGRKSDVNDAQWLQRLHACGLLRASFRPGREIAALRVYLRARERHLDYAAAHIQHMQKALTYMNLQLHHVISDLTGATGMKIIRAIVAGERNVETLAAFRDARCKANLDTIRGALSGNYQPEHLFALGQALALYDFYQRCIADCDIQIESAVAALNVNRVAPEAPLPKAKHRTKQPNEVNFNVRAAHARGRESYGALRLQTELAEMGFPCALSAVKRLRKRLGLRCKQKRRFVRTTDGNHSLPIAPNLLAQQFDQTSAPNQVWVTD